MTNEEVITLGKTLGLKFREHTNHENLLKEGHIVFDGCNGQRFSVKTSWTDEKILKKLGESVFLMGKRTKAVEVHNVLSINSDHSIKFDTP